MKTDLVIKYRLYRHKIYFQVAVPRLIPSRQELTVDQQARLCSDIGFTGDKAPRKGAKLIIEA